jgi:hypothetical protein
LIAAWAAFLPLTVEGLHQILDFKHVGNSFPSPEINPV